MNSSFTEKLAQLNTYSTEQRTVEKRPPNVPRQYANQAAHARYALHARIFSSGGFVSVENKECLIYFPKLDVAGSIPVARSIFLSNSQTQFSKVRETLELSRKTSRKFSLRNCQTLHV